MTDPTGRYVFTDDPIVNATHLNQLQTDRANGDHAIAQDALGAGIVAGLTFQTSSPPSMSMLLTTGSAYNALGQRLAVDLATVIDFGNDNTTGVLLPTIPTAGSTRWVSVVLRPFNQTVPGDLGAGQPFDRIVDSVQVKVIAGATAAPGAAVLPAIHTDDVLLGSVLLTSATTAVRTEDVSFTNVLVAWTAARVRAESAERMLRATPTNPPSLKIAVSPGLFFVDGEVRAYDGTLMATPFAPDATRYRIDLLHYDPDASPPLQIATGTPAMTLGGAVRPSTKGLFPIAFVTLTPADTAITAEGIEDARPWFVRDRTYIRRYQYTVVPSSLTSWTLPFAYTPGELMVYVNGGRLYPGLGYTEDSPTQITFTPGITSGSQVLVETIRPKEPLSTRLASVVETLDGLLVGGTVTVEDRGAGLHTYVRPISLMTQAKTVFTQDAEAVLAATGFPASVHRYLYASYSGAPGTLTFTFSGQEPDASLTWMGSLGGPPNRAYRYLGTVRSDSSGNLYPGTFTPREARYEPSDRPLADFAVAPSSGGLSQMSLAGFAPPFARRVRIETKVVGVGGGTGSVSLRRLGASGAWTIAAASPAGDAWATCEVGCNSSQQVETDATGVGGGGFLSAATFYARGWSAP